LIFATFREFWGAESVYVTASATSATSELNRSMAEHAHLNRIDDEIIAHMRLCRFMVADYTGQRQGVYFEAGFMQGLGRNVYWMCEKADLANVHFDNRQFNFIDYDSAENAKTRLYNRIMANEGTGPDPHP
jgi:hypothetical protein